MILATYQPVNPDAAFNAVASASRKALYDYLGFTPIWCFSCNNLKEFYINSILAAPNLPEVIYVFETDDYIPLDSVQWNICGYHSHHDVPFDISHCFQPCDPKYNEYLIKEIPEDKLILKMNLHDAIFDTTYKFDFGESSDYLFDFFNNVVCTTAAEFVEESIKSSSVIGTGSLTQARKMLNLRLEKDAFEGFLAGFIIGTLLPGTESKDFFAFNFKMLCQKKPGLSLLLTANYNGDVLPTYERQDKIIELISSCYQKAAPWGSVKIGRNDPCPCGSGKKYKKCCINKYE